MNDILDIKIIENGLSSKAYQICNKKIEIFDSIDSTNIEAKRRLNKEKYSQKTLIDHNKIDFFNEHGLILIADKQTNGQGRFGRKFYSPKGKGLYLTLVLCTNTILQDNNAILPPISLFTHITAASICHSLSQIGLECDIKWVNDIYFKNKKVSGILIERFIQTTHNRNEYLIIGIGINIEEDINIIPEELKYKVGALFKKNDVHITRNELSSIIVSNLIDAFYGIYYFPRLIAEYKKRLFLIGKNVEVVKPYSQTYKAIVLGITDDGYLIVKDYENKIHHLISEEVSINIEI